MSGCGEHGCVGGVPTFDHTCDDCMLPYNHQEPDNDTEDNQERNKTSTESAEAEPN